jgi:hypothetical protein
LAGFVLQPEVLDNIGGPQWANQGDRRIRTRAQTLN